jgi:2'-5' RNA ligase
MKYNLSIIPPRSVCKKAIAISEKIDNVGSYFMLGEKENFPHITIAHFLCNEDSSLSEIIKDIEKKFVHLCHFDIKSCDYRMSEGWIDVTFFVNAELQNIYDIILEILTMNNCVRTSDDWNVNSPHMTFSRIDVDQELAFNQLPFFDFSFTVHEIGLFVLGKNGTNKKILHKFKLQ